MNRKIILSDFVNHTGGAYGVDTFGHIIGKAMGFENHRHYRPYDNIKVSKTLQKRLVEGVILTKTETDIARNKVNKYLGKKFKDDISGNLQGRNFLQVNNADSVFCFSRKLSDNSISGGTNTAFQLSIIMNKPVYLFDIIQLQWYHYDTVLKKLVKCEIPILTKQYAIVGTRDIEDYQIFSKDSNKWESRKEYIGDDNSLEVKLAILNLYKNTLHNFTNGNI